MFNFDPKKLNGKIVEKGMTKEGLAMAIGIDRTTFFRRLKKNKILLSDVHQISETLGLTKDEIISIFLSK